MSNGIPPILGGEPDWRRLDPRMLLVHPVQEAVRFLPALLVVFLSGRTSGRSGWWDLGFLAVIVAVGVSRWFTTRYRIWGGQIELRQGLINRRLLATPADRVRSVDVSAPMWHRLLGLARVEIGTAGGGVGADRIVLDALAAPIAEHLRGELLHRSRSAELEPQIAQDDEPEAEQALVTLDPAWMRYAPLTSSGLVSAAAIWGFGAQYLREVTDLSGRVFGAMDIVATVGIGVAVALGVVAALLLVSVLAVTGYALTYWGFRLTRHPSGTLHARRGLLTVRATSLEEKRIRGVELDEPLGLRMAGAGRLRAVTTGLGRPGSGQGSSALTPPAPRAVVEATAVAIVADLDAVSGPLLRHGPAARRRRFSRALVPSALLCGGLLWLDHIVTLPTGVVFVGFLPLLAAPVLAADRYAALGHTLTARHLVVRAGSLTRRRDVIERDGVIGVTIRATYFQRRAGVVTLTATTAAGRQGYPAVDLAAGLGDGLAIALLGPSVGQFTEPAGST